MSNVQGQIDRINGEVSAQKALISQIATALEGKAGGGGIDTSDATATASDILSGKTAYVDGEMVTGSIMSKEATTYTPSTANQTIAAGQYLSGAQTIEGDSNLKAENIAEGVSIFGVLGAHKGGGTLKTASGTAKGSGSATFTITGLNFAPAVVAIYCGVLDENIIQLAVGSATVVRATGGKESYIPAAVSSGTFTPNSSGCTLKVSNSTMKFLSSYTYEWYAYGV